MVLALLAGRKTQTRRIIMHRDAYFTYNAGPDGGKVHKGPVQIPPGEQAPAIAYLAEHCRFGVPGDLLWVRERVLFNSEPGRGESPWIYRADVDYNEAVQFSEDCNANWRPSIHMPRRASRLTLRLTDVRVQRLNEISDPDCVAEGIGLSAFKLPGDTALVCYRRIWEEIHGQFSWGDNPWVWALSFEVWKLNVDELVRGLTNHETGCTPFRERPIAGVVA